MAWIRMIPASEATGLLREQYHAATQRVGRIWNIVSIMSQNPRVLQSSMGLYGALMHTPSALSRRQREMLAVVVSVVNECVY